MATNSILEMRGLDRRIQIFYYHFPSPPPFVLNWCNSSCFSSVEILPPWELQEPILLKQIQVERVSLPWAVPPVQWPVSTQTARDEDSGARDCWAHCGLLARPFISLSNYRYKA